MPGSSAADSCALGEPSWCSRALGMGAIALSVAYLKMPSRLAATQCTRDRPATAWPIAGHLPLAAGRCSGARGYSCSLWRLLSSGHLRDKRAVVSRKGSPRKRALRGHRPQNLELEGWLADDFNRKLVDERSSARAGPDGSLWKSVSCTDCLLATFLNSGDYFLGGHVFVSSVDL